MRWEEWIANRPTADVTWWPVARYWLRALAAVVWVAAASYELLVLFFASNHEAMLTPFVLQALTTYGSLAFLAGAAVARAIVPWHSWEPWPPPPWWGVAVVAGTAFGLALIDLVPGTHDGVPFAASGAFGTIVGHLFIAKCRDEDGDLTDCEAPEGSPPLRP